MYIIYPSLPTRRLNITLVPKNHTRTKENTQAAKQGSRIPSYSSSFVSMENEEMITVPEKNLSSRSLHKLVPWSSWEQWNFVRDSIFSSSPDSVSAALRRVSAWRTRGCLPVPVDITAAFVEIQQQDPFFQKDLEESKVVSEEMLTMFYSMAITRLVNGCMEHAHKKTGRSISDLAEAVRIPRMLVDIRHESSHRELPSLRPVRSASIKAIDWLKSTYWDPQKNAISDICVEIRSKLREMIYYIKAKELESEIKKGKRIEKHISRSIKSIIQLYSSNPSELVSILLLEFFFQMDSSDLSNNADVAPSDEPDLDELKPLNVSFNDMKSIITKLGNNEPKFVLSLLKLVLENLDSDQNLIGELNKDGSKPDLPSLFLWLITTLKVLKETGNINIINETNTPISEGNSVPSFCPKKLLEKCLNLIILGDKKIASSALILVDMVGNENLREKIKKIVMIGSWTESSKEITLIKCGNNNKINHDDSIKKALDKFEYIKSKYNSKININENDNNNNNNNWSVAKSWISCPIGMIPCSFSSTAILPNLDLIRNDIISLEDKSIQENHKEVEINEKFKRSYCSNNEENENEKALKKQKQFLLRENEGGSMQNKFPMKNVLLIDGVWRKIGGDELELFKSGIRIFV